MVQQADGSKVKINGVYIFGSWRTTRNARPFQTMKRLALNLLRTGVLERWAYVSYFSVCEPGQEDATFARMAKLIAASVPEFQLPP